MSITYAVLVLLAAAAAFVAYRTYKRRATRGSTHTTPAPAPHPSVEAPAPFEPPPSPVEDATPAMFARRDSDNFIQYAEVLALGPEWKIG